MTPRKNYICNFRAPDLKHYKIWEEFKERVKENGLDVCHVTLALCQTWILGLKRTKQASSQIVTPLQIINLQQQNTFVYSVQKPRREPLAVNCPRKDYSRTIRSRAFQAYVIEKVRDLKSSFSFRDFPELGHDLFRKCILRLKERKKIVPLEPRSNPRFYILSEWISIYPSMKKNNRVKPRFTRSCEQRGE